MVSQRNQSTWDVRRALGKHVYRELEVGLLRRYTHRKCGLLLKQAQGEDDLTS